MRIAYVCLIMGRADGVLNKMQRYAAVTRREKIPIDFFWLSAGSDERNETYSNVHIERILSGNSFMVRVRQALRVRALLKEYDRVILRYPLFDPILFLLLKPRHQVIIEHHTKEPLQLRSVGDPRWIIEKLFGPGWIRSFGGRIAVTPELAEYEQKRCRLKKPAGVFFNTIDLKESSCDPKQTLSTQVPYRLLFVASVFAEWQGLEHVLEQFRMANVFDLELHLVGALNEDQKKLAQQAGSVVVHGVLKERELAELYRNCDAGIGCFGLHLLNMKQAVPLKVREYVCFGLPLILGYDDPAFSAGIPYVLHLKIFDCVAVRAFMKSIAGTERNVVRETLSPTVDSVSMLSDLYAYACKNMEGSQVYASKLKGSQNENIFDDDRKLDDDATSLGRTPFPVLLWVREAFWVVLGQVTAVIGSLVGIRFLTGLMPPSMYGELALGVSAAMLAFYIVGDSFSQLTMRFFHPALQAGRLCDFFHATFRLLLHTVVCMLSIGATVLLFFGLRQKFRLLEIGIPALIFAFFSSINGAVEGVRNGARNRRVVAFHQAFFQWGRFVLAVVFIWCFGATASAALWGYALASLIVCGSQWLFLVQADFFLEMKESSCLNPREYVLKMRQYVWPFLIIGFVSWLFTFVDRLALSRFVSLDSVGCYTALVQIGYFPVILGSRILLQLVSPILYERVGCQSNLKGIDRVQRFNSVLTFCIIGVFMAAGAVLLHIHEAVFSFFVSSEYRAVSVFLPWTVLSAGIYAAGQVPLMTVMARYESARIMRFKVVVMLVGILFYLGGAYYCGLSGLVTGGLLFSVLHLIWACFLSKKSDVIGKTMVCNDNMEQEAGLV